MAARTLRFLWASCSSSISLKLKLVKVSRLPRFPSERKADSLDDLSEALELSNVVFKRVLVPRGIVILLLPFPPANVALPAHSLLNELNWACEIF